MPPKKQQTKQPQKKGGPTIEISKNDEKAIENIVKEYHTAQNKNSQENKELEAKIQDERIQKSKKAFTSIATALKVDTQDVSVMLDITVRGEQGVRYTIKGQENINTYLRTNDISQVDSVTEQTKTRIRGIELEEQDIKISLSNEKEKTPNFIDFSQKPKSFRYKVRMSSKKGSFRVDLTQVKSTPSKKATLSLAENDVIQASPVYEVEIEARDLYNKSAKATKDELLSLLTFCCTKGTGIDPFIGKSTKVNATTMLLQPFSSEAQNSASKAIYSKDQLVNLPGFKPVNMGLDNLLEPDVGVISIHDTSLGYTVTPKIDGIPAKGVCLNNVLYIVESDDIQQIRHSGYTIPQSDGTIFDGELVLRNVLHEPVQWFFIFDCYAVSGTRITGTHLMSYEKPSSQGQGRLDIATSLIEKMVPLQEDYTSGPLKSVVVKDFSRDIYNEAKRMWNEEEQKIHKYNTDGIVYTPNIKIPEWIVESGKRHWNKVLKWKSLQDMTIDFLAKIEAYSIQYTDNDGISHIGNQVALYCAISPEQPESMDMIDPMTVLTNSNSIYMQNNKHMYHFATTYCDITNDNNEYCYIPQTKERFSNNTIVECRYKNGYWNPVTVRNEKTQTYNRKKKQGHGEASIHDTANNYVVALSIYRDILYPVYPEYLYNENYRADNSVVIEKNTTYYSRSKEREHYYIRPMNNFHNNVIKHKLLNDAPHLDFTLSHVKKEHLWHVNRSSGNSYRLLDLACGQGGDLSRYMKKTYKEVIGIDGNVDNLLTPKTGAYARLNTLHHKNSTNIPIIGFLHADITQQIGSSTYEEEKRPINATHEENQLFTLGQVMTGLKTPNTASLKKYSNILTYNQFETISIMFAIHYVFEEEWMLDTFIETINTYLANGGILVGTCLDNWAVHRLSQEEKRNTPDDETAWMIRKKYDGEPKGYGKVIDVYVETIGQVHTEYLVDFELLQNKLKQKGIYLRLDVGFKSFFDPKTHKELNTTMKEFSFLNRAFIFRKEKRT